MHPSVVIRAYLTALEDALKVLKDKIAYDIMSWMSLTLFDRVPIDTSSRDEMLKVISSCLGTKMLSKW